MGEVQIPVRQSRAPPSKGDVEDCFYVMAPCAISHGGYGVAAPGMHHQVAVLVLGCIWPEPQAGPAPNKRGGRCVRSGGCVVVGACALGVAGAQIFRELKTARPEAEVRQYGSAAGRKCAPRGKEAYRNV